MAASDPTTPDEAAPRVALNQLKDELTAYAKEKAGTVREHANHLVDDQKTAAADNLHDLSDALRQAADHLARQHQTVITDLARSAADRVEAVAGAVRERDLGTLLDDTRRLAQRQPELFFAGAIALGFLFTRILRSPSPPGLAPPAPGAQPPETTGPLGPV
jgi:hypothetical protein